MAQFRELEAFAQFGSDLDAETQTRIGRGKRIVEILKQPQYKPLPIPYQVAIFYAVVNGLLDDVAVENIREFEHKLFEHLDANYAELLQSIATSGVVSEEDEVKLQTAIKEINS
jgi:F-type H+-transporting ATPase subunit alpha